jgi:hypothetical protein
LKINIPVGDWSRIYGILMVIFSKRLLLFHIF